jgi:hypothetical protein
MSDPRAVAVLEKHIPGASKHPQRHDAWHMTLAEVAGYPEAGISHEKLQTLLAELSTIE